MDAQPSGGVLSFFQDIPDPRAANVRFQVADIIAMAITAVAFLFAVVLVMANPLEPIEHHRIEFPFQGFI